MVLSFRGVSLALLANRDCLKCTFLAMVCFSRGDELIGISSSQGHLHLSGVAR